MLWSVFAMDLLQGLSSLVFVPFCILSDPFYFYLWLSLPFLSPYLSSYHILSFFPQLFYSVLPFFSFCLWAENGLKWMRSGRAVNTVIIWLLPALLKAEDALPVATLCFLSWESQPQEQTEKLICPEDERVDRHAYCAYYWVKHTKTQVELELIKNEIILGETAMICPWITAVSGSACGRSFFLSGWLFNTCWDIREIMWDGVDLIQHRHLQHTHTNSCTLWGSGISPPALEECSTWFSDTDGISLVSHLPCR